MSECRVALLAGGKSGEREVSLASAEGARGALEEAGYTVTQLDPADKEDLKRLIDGPFDVAFLCLHGKYGEDGTVQGLLETIGLPYIGSGVWSSALAMDKVKSKLYYEQAGIPTPPSVPLQKGDSYDVDSIVEKLGAHCVVKPGTEGSALGVFIVEGAAAIGEAIEKAFDIDSEVLVERYIKGKELTVAVIGDAEVEALPIIEIVPKSDFYDFESKYAPGGVRFPRQQGEHAAQGVGQHVRRRDADAEAAHVQTDAPDAHDDVRQPGTHGNQRRAAHQHGGQRGEDARRHH